MAPRRFARAVGVPAAEPEAVAAFGSRELAAGAALLSPVKFGPFLWLRVAGDAFDLGSLAWAARRPSSDRRLLGIAAVAVACMAAFDLYLALQDEADPETGR
jgi:hypothetical protein